MGEGVSNSIKFSVGVKSLSKLDQTINDLSLHCTDFFLETKNRSYCLHVLEEVELQMEVKMSSGGGEPVFF